MVRIHETQIGRYAVRDGGLFTMTTGSDANSAAATRTRSTAAAVSPAGPGTWLG
jgi:hypothetical protein